MVTITPHDPRQESDPPRHATRPPAPPSRSEHAVKLEPRLFLIWTALGFILALLIAGTAGALAAIDGEHPAHAILTAGIAFGGTMTLYMLLLTAFAKIKP